MDSSEKEAFRKVKRKLGRKESALRVAKMKKKKRSLRKEKEQKLLAEIDASRAAAQKENEEVEEEEEKEDKKEKVDEENEDLPSPQPKKKTKKRKLNGDVKPKEGEGLPSPPPKKKAKKKKLNGDVKPEAPPVQRRVSIALPGSILDNAQSPELRTYLAGQIARAATIFNIEEIVVFDEKASLTDKEMERFEEAGLQYVEGEAPNCNLLMAALLQYLECPQYLRKFLFPLNRHLRWAGLLNPLDAPHHMRGDDTTSAFREAVTLPKPTRAGRGSLAYAGVQKEVELDRALEPHVRVTVRIDDYFPHGRQLRGTVVSPREPVRSGAHANWGYKVRLAGSLSEAVTPPKGAPYDLTIGTSERGQLVADFSPPRTAERILVVLGGVAGLESCAEADTEIDVALPELFTAYLNTCPAQGSRTIRTEEALLITLTSLGF